MKSNDLFTQNFMKKWRECVQRMLKKFLQWMNKCNEATKIYWNLCDGRIKLTFLSTFKSIRQKGDGEWERVAEEFFSIQWEMGWRAIVSQCTYNVTEMWFSMCHSCVWAVHSSWIIQVILIVSMNHTHIHTELSTFFPSTSLSLSHSSMGLICILYVPCFFLYRISFGKLHRLNFRINILCDFDAHKMDLGHIK